MPFSRVKKTLTLRKQNSIGEKKTKRKLKLNGSILEFRSSNTSREKKRLLPSSRITKLWTNTQNTWRIPRSVLWTIRISTRKIRYFRFFPAPFDFPNKQMFFSTCFIERNDLIIFAKDFVPSVDWFAILKRDKGQLAEIVQYESRKLEKRVSVFW